MGEVNELDWSDVLIKATRLDGLVEQNERELRSYKLLSEKLAALKQKKANLKITIDRCTAIYKDVEQNLSEKEALSRTRYEECIKQASLVVRNSDVAGSRLKIDGKRAYIANSAGHDINLREGSAFRSVNGVLMRYTSIAAQMGYIPMILFDESFFTLSDNSSIEMRDYLRAFANDLLIIAIEQHDTLFTGLDGIIKYEFVKLTDKSTKIRKVGDGRIE